MKIKIRYKLPPTTSRVERNTRPAINEELRNGTIRNQGSPVPSLYS